MTEDAPRAASLARRASTVAGFTLASRVLGYVRDAVVAHAFGATIASDAFIAAQTIPNVLRRLVAEGTLMIAFVPILSSERESGGQAAMQRFIGAVLGLLVPVLVGLVLLGMLFPEVWVLAFASGFDAPRRELASRLVPIMMPFLLFISLTAVAAGALNTVGRFAPSAAAPMLLNVSIVGCIVGLGPFLEQPVMAAAFGVAFGGALQLVLQLPFLARHRLLVRPRLEPSHPGVVTLGRRMLPALFGVGVYQLNMVFIRQIASFLPQGQLTCYFLATRLEEFALGVFAVSISVAALPTMSEHAAKKDTQRLVAVFRRALRATLLVTVPSMAGLLVLAEPIVDVLFARGAFDASAADLTASLVRIMAFALMPIGAVRVMVPTYYAIGDTRTPVLAATASMMTTAGLGLALGPLLEIRGLTLATVAAATVQATLLALWLPNKMREALGPESARFTVSVADLLGFAIRCLGAVLPGACIAAWIALGPVRNQVSLIEKLICLGVLGTLLVLSYAAFAKLLRIEEVAVFAGWLRKRLKRGAAKR